MMHRIALVTSAFLLSFSPAIAQTPFVSASPIPDNAESRFCYYDGLAYSRSAYILVSSRNHRTQAIESGGALHSGGEIQSATPQKLLQCVTGKDGTLTWSSEAAIQIKN